MDCFDRQWSTDRAVVDHDLMQQRALTVDLTQAIEAWVAARPAGAPPARMVDLGCGDLGAMAPLLPLCRRPPGEGRQAYVARYVQRIRSS